MHMKKENQEQKNKIKSPHSTQLKQPVKGKKLLSQAKTTWPTLSTCEDSAVIENKIHSDYLSLLRLPLAVNVKKTQINTLLRFTANNNYSQHTKSTRLSGSCVQELLSKTCLSGRLEWERSVGLFCLDFWVWLMLYFFKQVTRKIKPEIPMSVLCQCF